MTLSWYFSRPHFVGPLLSRYSLEHVKRKRGRHCCHRARPVAGGWNRNGELCIARWCPAPEGGMSKATERRLALEENIVRVSRKRKRRRESARLERPSLRISDNRATSLVSYLSPEGSRARRWAFGSLRSVMYRPESGALVRLADSSTVPGTDTSDRMRSTVDRRGFL